MAWEENPRICLHMQLIAILSRTGVILSAMAAKVRHNFCVRIFFAQETRKPGGCWQLSAYQAGYFSNWVLTKTKGALPIQGERLSSYRSW